MISLRELDERKKKALEKMKTALRGINNSTDIAKKMEYNDLLNESFAELKQVDNDRIVYMGGYLK